MKLAELAKNTSLQEDQQNYLLGMLKEIAAVSFVEELCQVAYDLGFDDCLEDTAEASPFRDTE